jgi:cytochrome c
MKKLLSLILSIIVVLIATFTASMLYRPKQVIKRGYEIQTSTENIVAKKEERPLDFESLFKLADNSSGAKIFKKCSSCHFAENGAGNKVGPNLFGVVGRKKASASGFSYSNAMLNKGGNWTRQELNQFLENPKNFIPSTKMAFPGLKKPEDRANIILFLEKNTK